MSISTAQVRLDVTTTEALTGDDVIPGTTVIHNQYDVDVMLSGTNAVGAPDVTKAAFQTVAMTAGAVTVDLTALLLNAGAVTLTGLKPRGLRIQALAANGANVTVVKGASNGYTGMGSSFSVVLAPGQAFLFWFAATGTAVGSGVKTLDISGTGTDGVRLSVVAGPT